RFLLLFIALVLFDGSLRFSHANSQCEKLFKPTLRVAAVQYPIEWNKDLNAFLRALEDHVSDAKAQGAELVVFPELPILDMLDPSRPEESQLRELATSITPVIFQHALALARSMNISVLAGSYPRLNSNADIVNTAVLAFPDGRSVYQDKLFLTPDEISWHWVPGDDLKVFNAPWGKSVILICYDCEIPMISSILAKEKPEIFLIPSMTGEKGFYRVRWAAQARAVEHYAFAVHTGTVDEKGADLHGQAAILTPQDTGFPGVLAEGTKNRRQVLTGVLDLDHLRERRESAGIYPAKHQSERRKKIILTRLK
ncbi:MAG: nitrilase-related carbon-nitrogen hydrolase, partial [Bdellovibrionota bacterium]